MDLQRFRQRVPLRYLLPNMITLSGVYIGLGGVKAAVAGDFEVAMRAVVLAAACDGLDGRLARLLKGVSRFGAELDSLADFVNFGIVPAFILYFWSLHTLDNLGWVVCMVYITACALRLARFNVLDIEESVQFQRKKTYFMGVPSPAGALLGLYPLLGSVSQIFATISPVYIAINALVVAFLMVGTFKVPSWGAIPRSIEKKNFQFFVLFLSLLLILVVLYPWIILWALVSGYYVYILYCVYRASRAKGKSRHSMPVQ